MKEASMRIRTLRYGVILFVFLLIWNPPAFSQTSAGVTGTVTDNSGGSVSGVTVIITNGAIGAGYGPQGTIGSGTRADDTRGGAELMVNGNREMSNNYLLDGVDNNFRRNALITIRPTVESIQEFKMQANLFGAEQGRSSGATVNVVTKSGTNSFHGSLFEFLRNDLLDARNFFNAKSTAVKPPFRQN